ncbi:MAG: DUF2155 domain-containing protein [bacterium]
MKRNRQFLVSLGISPLALMGPVLGGIVAMGPALAQDTGWALADPDAQAQSEEAQDVGSTPSDAGPISVTRNGQQYGWLVAPRPVDEESVDRPLSELEELSKSTSGVRFGSAFYDSKSDNPLLPVSVTLRALDKITAKYTDLEINIDETAQFGTLNITPRNCDTRPPEEFPETTAFLEITPTEEDLYTNMDTPSEPEEDGEVASLADDDTEIATAEQLVEEEGATRNDNFLFSGWMYASSPALNALEHPVYDVWVIGCKMIDPET